MIKEFYTDGSCRGNPGPGGWSAVSITDGQAIWLAGQEPHTTNNRMELTGILKICEIAINDTMNEYIIYSDSYYCVNIINSWMWVWVKNNWTLTGKNQPVDNLDLVKPLYKYFNTPFFNVTVKKVPGHADVLGNELADRLACNKMDEFYTLVEQNNLTIGPDYKILPIKQKPKIEEKKETWVDFF